MTSATFILCIKLMLKDRTPEDTNLICLVTYRFFEALPVVEFFEALLPILWRTQARTPYPAIDHLLLFPLPLWLPLSKMTIFLYSLQVFQRLIQPPNNSLPLMSM